MTLGEWEGGEDPVGDNWICDWAPLCTAPQPAFPQLSSSPAWSEGGVAVPKEQFLLQALPTGSKSLSFLIW